MQRSISSNLVLANDAGKCSAVVHDLNVKYLQEGKGAPVAARFGEDHSQVLIRTALTTERFPKDYEKPV